MNTDTRLHVLRQRGPMDDIRIGTSEDNCVILVKSGPQAAVIAQELVHRWNTAKPYQDPLGEALNSGDGTYRP